LEILPTRWRLLARGAFKKCGDAEGSPIEGYALEFQNFACVVSDTYRYEVVGSAHLIERERELFPTLKTVAME
jgi:hypothetical protein